MDVLFLKIWKFPKSLNVHLFEIHSLVFLFSLTEVYIVTGANNQICEIFYSMNNFQSRLNIEIKARAAVLSLF